MKIRPGTCGEASCPEPFRLSLTNTSDVSGNWEVFAYTYRDGYAELGNATQVTLAAGEQARARITIDTSKSAGTGAYTWKGRRKSLVSRESLPSSRAPACKGLPNSRSPCSPSVPERLSPGPQMPSVCLAQFRTRFRKCSAQSTIPCSASRRPSPLLEEGIQWAQGRLPSRSPRTCSIEPVLPPRTWPAVRCASHSGLPSLSMARLVTSGRMLPPAAQSQSSHTKLPGG